MSLNTFARSVALAAVTFASIANAQIIKGFPTVIDGDTVVINSTTIRLHGIDAPEKGQQCTDAAGSCLDCGKEATKYLEALIRSYNLACETLDTDPYGRSVARCETVVGPWSIPMKVNEVLVEWGHALAYRDFSSEYVPQESAAATGGRGMWEGDFVEPWAHRRGDRLAACDISEPEAPQHSLPPQHTASVTIEPESIAPTSVTPDWSEHEAEELDLVMFVATAIIPAIKAKQAREAARLAAAPSAQEIALDPTPSPQPEPALQPQPIEMCYWVDGHRRGGTWVNGYYRRNGTYVSGHWRNSTWVEGYERCG